MKSALFDLDGVIVDTEPSYSIFWGEMGRTYVSDVPDFANLIKGTTLTQILDRYFPDRAVRKEVVRKLEGYERSMDYALFPDVIDFLEQLKSHGVRCAIVTSSNLEKMSNLWAQHPALREYFDAVITDEDVTHSKPHPEPFIKAAESLGVDPADCVVLEDSFNGLLSGRRSGATVVALATTNPPDTLTGNADIVVNHLSDIDIREIFAE